MAVVADYMDGNCRVVIHDDYVVKTPEERDRILKNMADIYVKYRMKEAAQAQAAAEAAKDGKDLG